MNKSIDDRTNMLVTYSRLFQEMHPNEHFIYASAPHGMVSVKTALYRPGYMFYCLDGRKVKTYFYYEEELNTKIRARQNKGNFKGLEDVYFEKN